MGKHWKGRSDERRLTALYPVELWGGDHIASVGKMMERAAVVETAQQGLEGPRLSISLPAICDGWLGFITTY